MCRSKNGLALGILMFLSCQLFAQNQTHIISFASDSVIYANAGFSFAKFIDARKDSTKLGILKETNKTESFQSIQFPIATSVYLKKYISSVCHSRPSSIKTAVVMHQLSINEEPLGAIEIAKSRLNFSFYQIKEGRYKFIRTVEVENNLPEKELSQKLGMELEKTVREAFAAFLSQPSSEGEGSPWMSLAQLKTKVLPPRGHPLGSIQKLEYLKSSFWLNNKKVSRKEGIAILRAVDDDEINTLLKKERRNIMAIGSFSALAAVLIGYPLIEYAGSENELNGLVIMGGSVSIIGSLLFLKYKKENLREATKIYNKRYNS